jgi:hypothetical protein
MRAGTTWMKRHKRTLTDKNGEELFTKITLPQELTRLALSGAVACTGRDHPSKCVAKHSQANAGKVIFGVLTKINLDM